MMPEQSLIASLREGVAGFSKSQRLLASFIAGHYQTVAFSTLSELASLSGVSEASIVRFARVLGFSGYPALQKEIRRLVRSDLKGTDRFSLTSEYAATGSDPLKVAIAKEMENIASLEESHDMRAFQDAIRAITGASQILVSGSRSTASLANHLWFGLQKLGFPADRSLAVTSETYDSLHRLDDHGCLIVIGFPRYLTEQLRLLDRARSGKLTTVVITDSPLSPLQGDINLCAPAESASFVAFHCAPLILLNTLLNEISLVDR
ncbi:MAG: MurR/RpiR family transcriptional regulator, partial [Rhodospirillales bacterium]